MADRVTLTRPAKDDLDAIWDYLAHEVSPEIADFVIARIFEGMSRAADHPYLYPETEFLGKPRRLNVFEYAVFYKPQTDKGILVLRVIHGRRNIARVITAPD